VRRGGARLRPLGFFVLMCGFGLRLDSSWQRLAAAVLVAGGALAAAGLVALGRDRAAAGCFRPAAGPGIMPRRTEDPRCATHSD